MTGRVVDLSLSLERKQRLTLELEEDLREKYSQLQGKELEIIIQPKRRRRSLDANAYCWVLIGKLSGVLRLPPGEVYRHYIPDVGGNYEVIPVREAFLAQWDRLWCQGHDGRMTVDMGPCRNTPGYHNVRTYFGSSDYDAAQMSRLIDLIVADCKEHGIETLPPYKLEAMKEGWQKQKEEGHAE